MPTVLLTPGRPSRHGSFFHAPGQHVRGPLISCLMITRGAAFPARFAIECYRRQSYVDRELVIVCDRPETQLSELLTEMADPTIRYIAVAPASLGELRNISVEQAHGALICQWDDDDMYHRQRLEIQARLLAADDDLVATFLHRWLIWWPERKVFAVSGRRTWEGTMLAKRSAPSAYPAQGLGEDNLMVKKLCSDNRTALLDWHQGYCYIVHGQNSYDANHFEQMIGWSTQLWTADRYDATLAAFAKDFELREYANALIGRQLV